MTENNLTDQFLSSILAISRKNLSANIIQHVKFSLIDYIGVTIGGSVLTHDKLKKLKNLYEDVSSEGLVIGGEIKASLKNSIFFNGINSHILELDDGSRYGVTHPGGPLFSALLPVAFRHNVGWESFAYGVVIGYETILRISTAIQPSHYNKGYHPTATCTPLGVAVGICAMLDLPFKVTKDAFSSACISAGGSLKAIENTSKQKVINAARGAELGFTSYCVAQAGFSGPNDVLSGVTGFLSIMASEYNPEILIRKENDPLWIGRVYRKLYASCRHTHGAIEGALRIKANYNISPEQIAKITIKIYKGIRGKHDIYKIFGEESAKMSIPYSTSAALVFGNANNESFDANHITNPLINNLISKTVIEEDAYISSLLPNKRATEICILTTDNKAHTAFVEYPIGEPENPLQFDDLIQKYRNLVKKSNTPKVCSEEIISCIMMPCPDMPKLYNLLNNCEI